MLGDIKTLLGIAADDTTQDAKINLIIDNTTARLKLLLGGIAPPYELDHVIVDVAISRYNRIGSEGVSAHSVDGESMTFADDDFAPYMAEINAYLDAQNDSTRGKLRFL